MVVSVLLKVALSEVEALNEIVSLLDMVVTFPSFPPPVLPPRLIDWFPIFAFKDISWTLFVPVCCMVWSGSCMVLVHVSTRGSNSIAPLKTGNSYGLTFKVSSISPLLVANGCEIHSTSS